MGNRLSRRVHSAPAAQVTAAANAPAEGSETIEHYRYDDSSNRLLAVYRDSEQVSEQRELSYDAVGNIIDDSREQANRALIYGANNRLQGVNGEDFGATYVYNAKGQRVIKRSTGFDGQQREVHFHYDLNDQLMAETDAQGQALREYLYLAGRRVAMLSYTEGEAMLAFVHNDHLGTPRLMTDASAAVVWSADSLPFGETQVAAVAGFENPLRFPGQYADEETGYYQNYFRDYDPSLGRYIQSDPIGLQGGLNTYAYVSNNPLNYVDPYGLAPDWVGPASAVLGATGGALASAGMATGNPYVGGAGLGLMGAAGALQIWDVVTTPMEQMESIQDQLDTIEDTTRGIQDLIDKMNSPDKERSDLDHAKGACS